MRLCVAIIVGVALLTAGCESDEGQQAGPSVQSTQPATTIDTPLSTASKAPVRPMIDPCKVLDLKPNLADEVNGPPTPFADTSRDSSVQWQGCWYWLPNPPGADVGLAKTNLTVPDLETAARNAGGQIKRFQVDGREAAAYQFAKDGKAECQLLVAVRRGSFEVLVRYPANVPDNGATCAIATDLANKISPLLPVG